MGRRLACANLKCTCVPGVIDLGCYSIYIISLVSTKLLISSSQMYARPVTSDVFYITKYEDVSLNYCLFLKRSDLRRAHSLASTLYQIRGLKNSLLPFVNIDTTSCRQQRPLLKHITKRAKSSVRVFCVCQTERIIPERESR
jgi:hypothetical protein